MRSPPLADTYSARSGTFHFLRYKCVSGRSQSTCPSSSCSCLKYVTDGTLPYQPIEPEVGNISPANSDNNVVFPAPFAPTIAIQAPSGISADNRSKITV